MSYEPDRELLGFARRFLGSQEALVEEGPAGLEVLLPPALAGRLETPEHIRLGGENAAGRENVFQIGYGSPLLDRMIEAACAAVPVTMCTLEIPYLKSQGFERLLAERFTFAGSVGKVVQQARVQIEYLLVTCRYLAQSDEQKGGLVRLAFNLESEVLVPAMAGPLALAMKSFGSRTRAETTPAWAGSRIDRATALISGRAQAAVSEEIGPFLASMTRRLRRDTANLEEYYSSLRQEMEQALSRAGLSGSATEERRQKIAQLPEELARKKDDLLKKYSVKVAISPCAALLVRTPAVKLLYRAAVGRRTTELSLLFNPVTKELDPIPCQGCGEGIYRVQFCPAQHLLCPSCGRKCPLCR